MQHTMKLLGFAVLLVLCAMLVGCTKMYTITTALEQPVPEGKLVYVGEITDNLPYRMKEKPTLEHIDKFRAAIANELRERELFFGDSTMAPYTVRGSINDYEQGSGAMRFLVGFGAGNAYVETHLELVETETGVVLFAGDFKGKVDSWLESGDAMFSKVAVNFVNQLAKQHKQLLKGQAKS